MKCQQLRDFVGATAIKLFEGPSNNAVISAAMPFEQAAISGFLGQCMAKDIDRAFGLDPFLNKLEMAQFAQQDFERPGTLPHKAQQAQREFAADNRRNLKKLLRPLG